MFNNSKATSLVELFSRRVNPDTLWFIGPLVVGEHVGLFQLKRKTQLDPPRQWFAVRK